MKSDLRTKNKTFSMESPGTYLREYASCIEKTLREVSGEKLNAAIELLQGATRSGRRVYVCGNGGSAAIADHLCCDWTKGTARAGKPALRTHSLTANSALFTAVANDNGYEESFATQIELYGESGDILVAISSSGNSANIAKAVESARAKGMKVIGLSGFSGGKLHQLADVSLYTPFDNYGLVEDCHQALMHVLSQYVYLKENAAERL